MKIFNFLSYKKKESDLSLTFKKNKKLITEIQNPSILIKDYIEQNRIELHSGNKKAIRDLVNILKSPCAAIPVLYFDLNNMTCSKTTNDYIEELEDYEYGLNEKQFQNMIDYHLDILKYMRDPEESQKNIKIYQYLLNPAIKENSMGAFHSTLTIMDKFLNGFYASSAYLIYLEKEEINKNLTSSFRQIPHSRL